MATAATLLDERVQFGKSYSNGRLQTTNTGATMEELISRQAELAKEYRKNLDQIVDIQNDRSMMNILRRWEKDCGLYVRAFPRRVSQQNSKVPVEACHAHSMSNRVGLKVSRVFHQEVGWAVPYCLATLACVCHS